MDTYGCDHRASGFVHFIFGADEHMGIKPNPRPGMSWGAMRKVLEQDNICNTLKGRIQYFQTRYRKAHDQTGRVAVRLDGKEIYQCDYFKFECEYYKIQNEPREKAEKMTSLERHEQIMLSTLSQVGTNDFYKSFYDYHNNSIDKSLTSPNAVVRLFAILDRRVGKRRLHKLLEEIEKQPQWLQVFYKLRMDAEGVVNGERVQ